MNLRRFHSMFVLTVTGITLLSPAGAYAQQVFGSIFGTVTDASGAAVPNAKVVVTDQNKGTRFEVLANESGNYTKGNLIPGIYQVEAEHSGFRKSITPDINVVITPFALLIKLL